VNEFPMAVIRKNLGLSEHSAGRRKSRLKERLIFGLLALFGMLSILTTAGIIAVLIFEAWAFFKEVPLLSFFFDREWTPLFEEKHFGILPLFCGTLLTTVIAMLVALPLGILSAVFLSEYASERLRRYIKPILEVLAGIPTVVYGYFALIFVTPMLQKIIPSLQAFNALSPGIVMGIMILPMMASLSEDAMYAVPRSLKDAAAALGSSKYQIALKVIIPSAFSGITAAAILAVSRAIGETMIVAIAAGQQAQLSLSPFIPIETMTAYIVQVSLGDTPTGTLEYRTIFAVGMMLFLSTLLLNVISHYLRKRFREAYE
jgi:phosphate transport system permease protein